MTGIFRQRKIDKALGSIGFNEPKFMNQAKLQSDKGKIFEMTFSSSIPIEEWEKKNAELEAALNGHIVNIEGKDGVVKLDLADASLIIPNRVEWNEKRLLNKDELAVGEGLISDVRFGLDKSPNMLLSGATGSGKSNLLRCLLWQCALKGSKLYVADFKHGVEFTGWESSATVLTESKQVLDTLKSINKEMKQRLDLFTKEGVASFTAYNNKHTDDPLCRIVFAIDEASEIFDTYDRTKKQSREQEEIINTLASIVRLNGKCGIHIFIASQFVSGIPGQIMNNIPIRIMGFTYDKLQGEYMGLPRAEYLDMIPGRMLFNDLDKKHPTEFQVYDFGYDKWIDKQNHEVGKTLAKLK